MSNSEDVVHNVNSNTLWIKKKVTKTIYIRHFAIGGNTPVSVQSMTCTKTEDVESTVDQIHRLEQAGCEIVRIAVPNIEAADSIPEIKKRITIPLVADIHFDYRLALKAIEKGADKIRINPGNIGSRKRVEKILQTAKEKNIPVRIGVNSGSLEKEIIDKYHGVTAEGLVESAIKHIQFCEEAEFENLVISIKASEVPMMIAANRLLSAKIDYPIHLGVTEAGTPKYGILRSAIGIGVLLNEGIGDTIRVSLTGDPVEEVIAGYEILKSMHIRKKGLTIVSCPTCGRTQSNFISIVEQVEKTLSKVDIPLTLAVMGCAVNGPGEAKKADIGIAFGKKSALLFKKGKVVRKIEESEIVNILVEQINNWEV
jgi:(E)-4-hydroxy-3-methylbut-2-enyl-diphosphate synthase